MDSSSEFRHQLAADRMAALRRSGEHGPPSALRRAVGSGLVRLGLRLRSDGRVPLAPADVRAKPFRNLQSFATYVTSPRRALGEGEE